MTSETHNFALASSNKVILILDDKSEFQYTVTNYSMTETELDDVQKVLPNITYFAQGSNISFTPLSVRFLVDDKYHNYFFILNEILSKHNGAKQIQRTMSLIFTDNHENPSYRVNFHNAYFKSISGFEVDNGSNWVSANVGIRFTHITVDTY